MIHETYTLVDLIKFWQRQMADKFTVIEALVNLVEYDKIPQDEKHKIIIETLHKYGLFEIGYKGDRNFLQKSRPIPLPEDPPKKPEDDIVWEDSHPNIEVPMELYNIRLMNAVVQFENIMN